MALAFGIGPEGMAEWLVCGAGLSRPCADYAYGNERLPMSS